MKYAFVWISLACTALCILISVFYRHSPKRLQSVLRFVQIMTGGYVGLALLALSIPRGITALFAYRPNPPLIERDLFDGIHYTREAITDPVPMVIHVVRIDLDTPELRFFVTPPDTSRGREVRAQTTSDFLTRYHLQLAINADGWSPWWDISPMWFYPHRGDSVDVSGYAASEGSLYSDAPFDHATLFISEENAISFNAPIGDVYNAVTGKNMLLDEGKPHITWNDTNRNPRTVVALDEQGQTLIIIVVDGRQVGYSEGATMTELAEIAIRHGAYTAINLDGGGSTTLVISDASGSPILLNAPIHNHMPYWERPVANHLGIYAQAFGD